MATVLIVDDEVPIVDLLADIVEERGHVALRADNGAKGLELARAARPDLIISDIMMPLLDGYALLSALRSEPDLAHTTIVLVSAGFPRAGQLAANAQADIYLRKPFDINTIEGLLDQLPIESESVKDKT